MSDNLEAAIASLIALGEKDPLTIVDKLVQREGDEWLREQGAAYASDFAADLARRLLGSQRRSSEVALRTGDQVTSAELKLRSYWVPEVGWKSAAQLTPTDFLARASFYDRLAGASVLRAKWCREVAELMVAEGAKTLAKLRVSLPPLEDDDLAELVAG